jgi:hypothetical protein
MTTEQRHIVTCVTDIIKRHFSPRGPLQLSLRRTVTQNDRELQIVDSILGNTHNKIHWQIRVSVPGTRSFQALQENDEKPCSYMNFISPERGASNATGDLQIHVKSMYYNSILNPTAKLLAVTSEHVTAYPRLLALSIVEKLYTDYKIINLVALTPVYKSLFTDTKKNLKQFRFYQLNIHTWFPFTSNDHCDTVKYVTHFDTWLVQEHGYFLKRENLFPEKIPTDLQDCPFKVSGYLPELDKDMHLHNHAADHRQPNFTQIEINFIAIVLQKLNLPLIYYFHSANNKSDIELNLK